MKKILLYVREEYAGLYAGVTEKMKGANAFVFLTPTIKAYNRLRKAIGDKEEIYCIEKDLLKYDHTPSSAELSAMEEELNEPLFLLNFSEIFIVKAMNGVFYQKGRDMQFYAKTTYFYYRYFKDMIEKHRPDIIFFE